MHVARSVDDVNVAPAVLGVAVVAVAVVDVNVAEYKSMLV